MRLVALALLTACNLGASQAPEVRIDFVDTPTEWQLTHTEAGHTQIALQAGEHSITFGEVDAHCLPTQELPFTEVNGQRSFAALTCQTPQDDPVDFVLIEVHAEDPSWPHPVALAAVLTSSTEEGSITMRGLGSVEIPLGVVPQPPQAPAEPEPPSEAEPPSEPEQD